MTAFASVGAAQRVCRSPGGGGYHDDNGNMAVIMMMKFDMMTRMTRRTRMMITSVYSDMASFLCCSASFNSFDCSFSFSCASHRSLTKMIRMMKMMTTTTTMMRRSMKMQLQS